MNTIVISLGGEDYSAEYNSDGIYSVNDMANNEIELTDELEQEILNKLCKDNQ